MDEFRKETVGIIEAKISAAFPGTYYGTTFDCAEAVVAALEGEGFVIVRKNTPLVSWDAIDNAIHRLVAESA